MDLTAEKIYCRGCKNLLSSRHMLEGETPTIACNGCNAASCVWNRVSWKYIGG